MLEVDFAPLFRSTIGFDHLAEMLENASRLTEAGTGYPPYDILKTGEDAYRITMAVAGFTEAEIGIEQNQTLLTVTGRKGLSEESKAVYLHRGIAERAFERRFQLADYVRVTAARLENGLLMLDLAREVPEEMKPRRIAISGGPDKPLLDGTTTRAA
jgi:molecular chaperone IbpA